MLATLTSRPKLLAASSLSPCGALAPAWQPEVAQVTVNTLSWISEKFGPNTVGGGGGAVRPDPSPPSQAETANTGNVRRRFGGLRVCFFTAVAIYCNMYRK